MNLSDSYIFKDELAYGGYVRELVDNVDDYKIQSSEFGINWEIFKSIKGMPMVVKLTHLVEKGIIIPIYKHGSNNIVPFIPFTKNNRTSVIVNVTSAVNDIKEEVMNGKKARIVDIDAKMLYSLLLCAGTVLTAKTTDDFKYNSAGRDYLMYFHVNMWTLVLNRFTSLASSPDSVANFKYIMVYYLMSKWYNGDEESCSGVAYKIARPKNMDKVAEFHVRFKPMELANMNIKQFLDDVLKVMVPQLLHVDISKVIQQFNSNLSAMNVLSIDYLPYVAAAAISYYDDFMAYRNKTLSKDLLQEARDTAIVLERLVETRLDYIDRWECGGIAE